MKFKFGKYLFLISFALLILPLASQAKTKLNLEIVSQAQAFTTAATLNITASSLPIKLPWQWQALGPVYNYSFQTSGFYDPSRPLLIKIHYQQTNNNLKKIFIFDSWAKVWRPLPTTDFPQQHYAQALTTSISGRLLLAVNSNIMTVGTASWYRYRHGLFAASPDFPKGSTLKVINLENHKSVIITVNDYGPERAIFPQRVIDLDYVAFQKIANPSVGLIKVKVEPQKVSGLALHQALVPKASSPKISAWSAVIMSEKTGKVLWGKNQNKVSPLASLSKLIAMRVFLDTRPSLNEIVTYKKQDENYNYRYVLPWQSAHVSLYPGEKVTVKDLMYSALLGSANNAVESLVRASGLKRPVFIQKMNELVKSWGATNTHFVEPTGLSPQNVSSPLDYAIITREIFTNPLLQEISTTRSYRFQTLNTHHWHTIHNTDRLLRLNTYRIIGSKTGYLDEAKYCLMTRVRTTRDNLILVNFGSKSRAADFADNVQLIRYGLQLLKK